MIYEWIIAKTEDNITEIKTFCGTDYDDVCRKAYGTYKYSINTDLAEITSKPCNTYEEFKSSPHHEIYYADTKYSDHIVFKYHRINTEATK